METPDFPPPYFSWTNSKKLTAPFFEFWRSILPNRVFRRLALIVFIAELIWFGFLFQTTIGQTDDIVRSTVSFLAIFGSVIFAFWLVDRTKIPDSVIFILLGVSFSPFINFPTGAVEQITLLSLAIILFFSGFEIEFGKIKKLTLGLTLAAAFGLFISATLLSFSLYRLTSIALFPAILLAISLAATDLSSVASVVAKIDFRQPIFKKFIIFESVLTGAFTTIIILILIGFAGINFTNLSDLILQIGAIDNLIIFGKTLLLGAVCGLAFGSLILMFASGAKEYQELKEVLPMPLFLLAAALGAYTLAITLGGSGLLAAFLAGMIFQVKDHHRPAVDFLNQISVFIKAIIFILLGSFLDFGKMVDYLWLGILLAIIFSFIIRPLAVTVSAWPDLIRKRLGFGEIYLLSSIYQVGTISGCLVILFIALKLPYAEEMLNLVIIFILTTLIIQPVTTAWLAKRLNLVK